MSIKKYTNGSWTPASRKYGTETDSITTFPATIIGDGTPITSYTIRGNMEQNGTPTPSSPIYPSECGERTANLVYKTLIGQNIKADGEIILNSDFNLAIAKVVQGETYSISNGSGIMAFYIDEPRLGTYSIDNTRYDITPTVTIPQGANYIAFRYIPSATPMLNAGSIPLPYEPYGYKLPLTLGSTTTDIYLGEVQSTRRVKKLVLTGEEIFTKNASSSSSYLYYTPRNGLLPSSLEKTPLMCNELPVTSEAPVSQIGISADNPFNVVYVNFGADVMNAQPSGNTTNGLKEYLAQQYTNGTPVTVWYVLAEPETAVVNEPIRKIGDYVDSVSGTGLATSGAGQAFDINTTLKPSEADLTYHGWHEHEDTKYST